VGRFCAATVVYFYSGLWWIIAPALTDIEWSLNPEGYRLVEGPDRVLGWDSRCIEPISDKRVWYRPLEKHPALFREFADTEQSPDGVLAFAGKFGLLRDYFREELKEKEDRENLEIDSLGFWISSIERMKEFVDGWENNRASGDVSQTVGIFNELDGSWIDCLPVTFLRLSVSSDPLRPNLWLQPLSLLSAMWLQFAQAVASGSQLRRCAVCPNWFVFGTGTGRRKSAYYCSDRCRKAAHRANKEQRK
jgi:hypothetical protein